MAKGIAVAWRLLADPPEISERRPWRLDVLPGERRRQLQLRRGRKSGKKRDQWSVEKPLGATRHRVETGQESRHDQAGPSWDESTDSALRG